MKLRSILLAIALVPALALAAPKTPISSAYLRDALDANGQGITNLSALTFATGATFTFAGTAQANARHALGLGIGDSPTFTGLAITGAVGINNNGAVFLQPVITNQLMCRTDFDNDQPGTLTIGEFTTLNNSSGSWSLTPAGALTIAKVGIGTSAPDTALEVNLGTSGALRLTNNDADGGAANYADLSVNSSGNLTLTPSGGTVSIPGTITSATWAGGTIPVNKGGTGITSLGAGIATWLGTPSSANLAAALTDKLGYATGARVIFGDQAVSQSSTAIFGKLRIATTSTDATAEFNLGTTGKFRLTNNDADGSAAHYVDFAVESDGDLSIVPSHGNVDFTADIHAIDLYAELTHFSSVETYSVTTSDTQVNGVADFRGQAQFGIDGNTTVANDGFLGIVTGMQDDGPAYFAGLSEFGVFTGTGGGGYEVTIDAGGNLTTGANTVASFTGYASFDSMSAHNLIFSNGGPPSVTLSNDGSASFAGGLIAFDSDGNATLSGGVVFYPDGGAVMANSNVTIDPNGRISTLATVNLHSYTVATLPSTVAAGEIAYVTDALAPTYNATLVGGGSVKTLALFNGAIWTAH